ncbi:serine/threonine protein kinase [Gigaspora margarita]|uniref:Serine/threonine protein kinase n=1 Tax=Gigaspora margarita TaxID=4874 RepID=A0A8H4AC28_GIGMA|nr:serine/threonine protein kinase [Gigaspora margarita]
MIHETTSRNKDIDAYIKEFQLRTREYEGMIEWIPFDRLENIKTIGRGGFGTVFSAIWLDGIRTINADVGNYIKAREKYSMVALKALPDSKKNSLDFLKEVS